MGDQTVSGKTHTISPLSAKKILAQLAVANSGDRTPVLLASILCWVVDELEKHDILRELTFQSSDFSEAFANAVLDPKGDSPKSQRN
jgi:hypothetical protein